VPLPDNVSDAVIAAKNGDAEGWNWLFRHFYPVVLRYTLAHLARQSDAEDIVQEVFVSATRSLSGLRSVSEPVVEAWFLRIAKYRLVDEFRRESRSRRTAPEIESSEDPASLAEDALLAHQVRMALRRLNRSQRDVLVRRFVLDHSLERVAEASGRPVGAVKALQHRALATLEKELAKTADYRRAT